MARHISVGKGSTSAGCSFPFSENRKINFNNYLKFILNSFKQQNKLTINSHRSSNNMNFVSKQ